MKNRYKESLFREKSFMPIYSEKIIKITLNDRPSFLLWKTETRRALCHIIFFFGEQNGSTSDPFFPHKNFSSMLNTIPPIPPLLASVFHIKIRSPVLEGVFDGIFAKNRYKTSLSQKALLVAVFHNKKEGLSLRVFLMIFSLKMGIKIFCRKRLSL